MADITKEDMMDVNKSIGSTDLRKPKKDMLVSTVLENKELLKESVVKDPSMSLAAKIDTVGALDDEKAIRRSGRRLQMAAEEPAKVQEEIQNRPPSMKDQFVDALLYFSPQIIGGLIGGSSGDEQGALAGMQKGAELRDSYLNKLNSEAASSQKAKSDREKMDLESRKQMFTEEKEISDAMRGDRKLDLEEREMNKKFNLMAQETAAEMSKEPALKDLPAATVNLLSEGKVLPKLLESIPKIIDDNDDLFGPIAGEFYERNPYSTKAKLVQAELKAKSQAFGRYMEGGVLRKEDEEKYREMFPKLTDTKDVAKGKLAIVKKLLKDKQNEYVSGYLNQGFNAQGFAVNGNNPSTSSKPVSSKVQAALNILDSLPGGKK